MCRRRSILQGESSIHATIREVKEEVGITLNPVEGRLVFTQIRDIVEGRKINDINDIYLFEYDGNVDLSQATTDEVADIRWMSKSDIKDLFNNGEMVSVIKDLSYFVDDEGEIF